MEAKIEKRRIKELIPNEWNPNEIPKEKLTHLKKEMARVGYLQPILINKDNVVIDGHHRLKILKELRGEDIEIPVVVVDMSDKEAKLQIINMNLIKGIMNPMKLGKLLTNLEEDFEKERLSGLINMREEEIEVLERVKEQQKEEAQMLIHSPVGKETYQKVLEEQEQIERPPEIEGTITEGIRLPLIFFFDDIELAEKVTKLFKTNEFGWHINSELNTTKLINLLKEGGLLEE